MKGKFLAIFTFLICLISSKADMNDYETTEEITISDSATEQLDDETWAKNENGDAMKMQGPYDLPADAESIRPNIVDSEFKCDERDPGYYADTENECQIFHRCVEGRSEVFSFICPKRTTFDQSKLVCVWDNEYEFDCADSEKYYRESNRAFLGNYSAEMEMTENIKNSHEIQILEQVNDKDEIKFYEFISTSSSDEENRKNIEENTIEDLIESTSTSEEIEESNDYQAELIPSSLNHIDASIATSADSSISISHPQKISFFIDEPIVEFPTSAPANNIDDVGKDDQIHESVTNGRRNIRKRSGNHRNRFLFKADNTH